MNTTTPAPCTDKRVVPMTTKRQYEIPWRAPPGVRIIDANIGVAHRIDQMDLTSDRDRLLRELDDHGVSGAVVYHMLSDAYSPVDGNLLLTDWIGNEPRLTPLWGVVPTSDSQSQVEGLIRDTHNHGVRYSVPRTIDLPFEPWVVGDLLTTLADLKAVLWIPISEVPVSQIVATLNDYPRLDVVLTGAHYTHHLWVRPLLTAMPRAHLELSRYEVFDDVRELVREFGAERLMYGSGYPGYAMGPILFYLHHIKLTDRQLALIAGGNLERLMGQR